MPLWARAVEAGRHDAIVRDPRAAAIRGRLDYDFTPLEGARASQVGCCVRARLIDDWVRTFLAAHRSCTVVELGCGLNGRFERVDDGRVRWIDLDLPGAIALRRRFFDDTARCTMLPASVLDSAWMDQVAATQTGPLLFVTEGLLPYLQGDQVQALFGRLADRFPGAGLIFDTMTPLVLRYQRHHDAMRHFDAPFTFGVANDAAVAALEPRLVLEQTTRFHDLLAAHATRLPPLLRWIGVGLGRRLPSIRRAYSIHRARVGSRPPTEGDRYALEGS